MTSKNGQPTQTSDEPDEHDVRIDSPIHQLRTIEEFVLNSGSAVFSVLGIEEFAQTVQGLSVSEIVCLIQKVNAHIISSAGPPTPDALPLMAVIAFVPSPLAEELELLTEDEVEEFQEDE